MISVLHVIDSLATGGAEHQLTDLLLRSDRGRFCHTVCSLSSTVGFAEELRRGGIAVVGLDLPPKNAFLTGLRRVASLTRRVQPDILHASLYRSGMLARVVGQLRRIPVITTLVNTTYEPEWRLDNPYLRRWKVAILQALDATTSRRLGTSFVAISRAVKSSAVRRLGIPDHKIQVIYRGFPFADARPLSPDAVAAVRRQLAPDADPLIVNVGRLVPQKGQRYLIEAVSQIVHEFPRARVLIIGEGWLRRDLEELIASRRLAGTVRLLGERHDTEVLLEAADIFAFPSLYEGFGVSLLEAMAARKPVVASNIEVLREVTDDGRRALLVPSRSPQAIAEAILTLARDRERAARLGALAAAWAEERFDIGQSVSAHEALYQAVLDGRGGVR